MEERRAEGARHSWATAWSLLLLLLFGLCACNQRQQIDIAYAVDPDCEAIVYLRPMSLVESPFFQGVAKRKKPVLQFADLGINGEPIERMAVVYPSNLEEVILCVDHLERGVEGLGDFGTTTYIFRLNRSLAPEAILRVLMEVDQSDLLRKTLQHQAQEPYHLITGRLAHQARPFGIGLASIRGATTVILSSPQRAKACLQRFQERKGRWPTGFAPAKHPAPLQFQAKLPQTLQNWLRRQWPPAQGAPSPAQLSLHKLHGRLLSEQALTLSLSLESTDPKAAQVDEALLRIGMAWLQAASYGRFGQKLNATDSLQLERVEKLLKLQLTFTHGDYETIRKSDGPDFHNFLKRSLQGPGFSL